MRAKSTKSKQEITAARRAHLLRVRNTDPSAATAAALASPKGARAPTNAHAKTWHLIDPTGEHHHCTNLQHFIRTHAHLFDPQDTAIRRPSAKGRGEYTRAGAGIQNIRAGKTGAWKGWTLVQE